MSDQKMLRTIAENLNLRSTRAVQKASEYYRLCSAKSTLGLSKISDTAKICVVLHIASEECLHRWTSLELLRRCCREDQLFRGKVWKLVCRYKTLRHATHSTVPDSAAAPSNIATTA